MMKSIIPFIALLGAAVLVGCGFRVGEQTVTVSEAVAPKRQVLAGIEAADKETLPTGARAVRALIVPHHLAAAETAAAGIRMFAGRKVSRIILLSPDHFRACTGNLCVMRGSFATAFGTLRTDDEAVHVLQSSTLVSFESAPFYREHGILAVLPFIAHYAPDTTVVPLILSDSKPWRDALPILRSILKEDDVLVVSSDFSHYLPLAEADAMDAETAKTFLSKDMDGIAHLENPSQSDCPGCLWLLSSLADEGGFFNPSVLRHTNAARILGDVSAKETTSHFAIAFYANAALSQDDPAFAGDVTVTRAEGKAPRVPASLHAFWSGSGARVVNLEGPLGEGCVPDSNPFVFCNERSTWEGLKGAATHWVTLNNHMYDRGVPGHEETVSGIADDGEMPVSFEPVVTGNLRMFSFTALMNPAEGRLEITGKVSRQKVLDALKRLQDGKLNVVYVHGGTEYDALPTESESAVYRSFIDAGADAVIAVHSHVPGDMEIYRDKPIFRGLGNFLFDQFDEVPTRTAKLVRLRKGTDGRILFETMTVQ